MQRFESKTIDEATPEELKAYAIQFLGIPIDDTDTDATVLAKVRSANEGDIIWIAPQQQTDQTGSAPPAPDDVATGSGLMGGLGRGDPKVQLTIHAEERDGVVNTRHKEVGVNGVVWLIKRGVSVEVPYRVYLVLQNAIRDNQTHDLEGNMIHQNVHSVPFSVERMPSQAEIDAWEARTRDQFAPA